ALIASLSKPYPSPLITRSPLTFPCTSTEPSSVTMPSTFDARASGVYIGRADSRTFGGTTAGLDAVPAFPMRVRCGEGGMTTGGAAGGEEGARPTGMTTGGIATAAAGPIAAIEMVRD